MRKLNNNEVYSAWYCAPYESIELLILTTNLEKAISKLFESAKECGMGVITLNSFPDRMESSVTVENAPVFYIKIEIIES